jgi:hypothetical protein
MSDVTKARPKAAPPVNDVPLRNPRWRDYPNLKIHPVCDALPLMSPEKLKALVEDIRKNGLRERVKIRDTPDGIELIDGRNRLDAMDQFNAGSYEFDPAYFEKIDLDDDEVWDSATGPWSLATSSTPWSRCWRLGTRVYSLSSAGSALSAGRSSVRAVPLNRCQMRSRTARRPLTVRRERPRRPPRPDREEVAEHYAARIAAMRQGQF